MNQSREEKFLGAIFFESGTDEPVDLAAEREAKQREAYYGAMNSAVVQGDHREDPVGWAYVALRNRASRYLRLIRLNAPQIILDNELKLIEKALEVIDPHWNDSDYPA